MMICTSNHLDVWDLSSLTGEFSESLKRHLSGFFHFIYDAESSFAFLLEPIMPGFALLGFSALIFLSLLSASTLITRVCVSRCFPSRHSLLLY